MSRRYLGWWCRFLSRRLSIIGRGPWPTNTSWSLIQGTRRRLIRTRTSRNTPGIFVAPIRWSPPATAFRIGSTVVPLYHLSSWAKGKRCRRCSERSRSHLIHQGQTQTGRWIQNCILRRFTLPSWHSYRGWPSKSRSCSDWPYLISLGGLHRNSFHRKDKPEVNRCPWRKTAQCKSASLCSRKTR